MNKTYHADTYDDDMQAIRKSDKVTDEDVELLAKYIIVAHLSGNDLSGETYEDMLDKIKSLRKNNDELLSQQEKEEEFNRQRFGRMLKVNLQEKEFSNTSGKDLLTYTVVFNNTSGQDIKMIIGNIRVNDMLEKEIEKIDIMLEEPLHTGATLKKIYCVPYSHANENDQRMRMKNLAEMRVEWNPSKIVFGNGTVAE